MDIDGLKSTVDKIPLELIAPVYNINHCHNSEILKKSETLGGYSLFIEKIREYQKEEESLEKAVRSAIYYCIKNNILKDFLRKHGSEVLNMLLEDLTKEEYLEMRQEELREEIRKEANLENAKKMKAMGFLAEQIQAVTELSTEAIDQL